MEVSRRKSLQKHLEPARPLRRCIQFAIEPKVYAATVAQPPIEVLDQQTSVSVQRFYEIANLHKRTNGRISYTRDFLISLATCPQARRKPEYLPQHPIVLPEARDPGCYELQAVKWNVTKEERAA